MRIETKFMLFSFGGSSRDAASEYGIRGGPFFPDPGATPIYGAKLPWFSKGHAAQLRQYHEMCVREGRSLVWSTYESNDQVTVSWCVSSRRVSLRHP